MTSTYKFVSQTFISNVKYWTFFYYFSQPPVVLMYLVPKLQRNLNCFNLDAVKYIFHFPEVLRSAPFLIFLLPNRYFIIKR